ncbi:MAG: metallophosphoesterase family protein [Gemmatimonadota bacterium]|nr:metallophosphoesterase family protein [Gemmatimonadota bacterium]
MPDRPSASSRERRPQPTRQDVPQFRAGDRLGVVSDSHGLLRPRVVALLQGVRAIIHAGDVGKISVLEGLERIAPVYAVRGNVDLVPPCSDLPKSLVLTVRGQRILVTHILEEADPAGFDLVVCGHSHIPKISAIGSTRCLNPGSIGPRRFRLPVSMGYIAVSPQGTLVPELRTVEIE